jgi:hypothetical protein
VLFYDAISRLKTSNYDRTSPTAGGQTQGFTYDNFGNLLSVTGSNPRSFCTTSCTSNQFPATTPDGKATSYVGAGNLKKFGTETRLWDTLNRLTEYQNTGIDWEYLYAGNDERLVRFVNIAQGPSVTRREMAHLLVQAKGETPTPVANCTPTVGPVFSDVPCQDPDWAYIQKFYEDGITAGCGGGLYCPDSSVTRAQMAVFLLKAEHGSTYTPPVCTAIPRDHGRVVLHGEGCGQPGGDGVFGLVSVEGERLPGEPAGGLLRGQDADERDALLDALLLRSSGQRARGCGRDDGVSGRVASVLAVRGQLVHELPVHAAGAGAGGLCGDGAGHRVQPLL